MDMFGLEFWMRIKAKDILKVFETEWVRQKTCVSLDLEDYQ